MIFHILYTDEYHKSDGHLIVDAQNENKAQAKVEHFLRSKHAQKATICILRQGKFSKDYANFSFFKIFFQNGSGEKQRQILAQNQGEAEKIFSDRFPFKEIIRIEKRQILSHIAKQPKKIKYEGITAQPLAAVA